MSDNKEKNIGKINTDGMKFSDVMKQILKADPKEVKRIEKEKGIKEPKQPKE